MVQGRNTVISKHLKHTNYIKKKNTNTWNYLQLNLQKNELTQF